jgi:hypothetical protein
MKLSKISSKCWASFCSECDADNCSHICHKEPRPAPRVIGEDKWFQIQEDTMRDEYYENKH